ncbi:MAG: hypothetical protein H3C34_09080 [Caldilineaceae bacterium]|nr:hypothetical protein [Caldilineaceae bacterium]
MSEENGGPVFGAAVENAREASRLLERLFEVTTTDALFSAPVTAGDTTVITASELTVGMGVGFGGGSDNEGNGGGGGGGGGYAAGRPVAVITVGPLGVQVKPVFDLTKIGIALVAALVSLIMARANIRRIKRELEASGKG